MPQIITGNMRFSVIDPMCVRMEFSPDGKFRDLPTLFAANRSLESDCFTTWSDSEFHLKTAFMEIRYSAAQMRPASGTLTVEFEGGSWRYGQSNKGDLGGVLQSLDDCREPLPLPQGFLSREGWQVIDDTKVSVLKDGWISADPHEENYFDIYFFSYGHKYKDALKLLMKISGEVPMLPRWCMGSWYSRWFQYTSDDYRQIVKEYAENKIPLDVMVMDMEWHTRGGDRGYGWGGTLGWTGWSWNRELLPDAEQLLEDLRESGLYVTMNVHPHDGIRSHEDCYADFMAAMGESTADGNALSFNAADRKYMKNYFKFAHEPLEKAGCSLWWVDWQQDCIYPSLQGITGQKHVPWLNRCYFDHSRQDGRRGIAFSRWGGFGDQKHPIHFSGDTTANWSVLAFQIAFTSLSGNSGCFFWTHDMGGFCGERNPELYARWLQFGVLSAALRLHSAGDDIDRRPWKWEEPYFSSLRESFRLRSALMPYLYTEMRRACLESVPMLRPLYLEYPEDDEAYCNMQEFFCGDDLLAAPVTSEGRGGNSLAFQKLYVPDGEFCNFFSGVYYCKGTYIVPSNLNEMPLFVRTGVPFVLGSWDKKHLSEADTDFEIQYFPPSERKSSSYTLYEDDGISDVSKSGEFSETEIVACATVNGVIFEIKESKGTFNGMQNERNFTFKIRNAASVENVFLNGQKIGFIFENGVISVGAIELKRNETLRLEINFKAESNEVLCNRAVDCYSESDKSKENEILLNGSGVLQLSAPLTGKKSFLVFTAGLTAMEFAGTVMTVDTCSSEFIIVPQADGKSVFRYCNGAVFEFRK